MRFLHTSDWHLGKIFHEHSLIEDQKFFLDQIITCITKSIEDGNPFSAILIPGDIYDRAVPSAEATELFSNFLAEINKQFPSLHLFIISGNHDSATRLSFASHFFNAHNIHIVTDTKNYTSPVVLEKDDEKVCVYQLPFLQSLSIKSSDVDEDGDPVFLRTQGELYTEACKNIVLEHKKNYGTLPSIVCAHLFTMGSLTSGSERSNVGTAEQVDVNLFKDFSYGAFGHIHKKQNCDKEHKCWYSGSPLAYNFDDNANTCMLDVQIDCKTGCADVKEIPIQSLHPIVKLEGKFEDFCGSNADLKKWKKYENNYVQVTLTDEVHVPNSYDFLKAVFPNLMLISRLEKSGVGSSSIKERKEAINSKNPEIIFNQFLNDIYGEQFEKSELVEKEIKLMEEEAKKLNWGDMQ